MKIWNWFKRPKKYPTEEETKQWIAVLDEAIAACDEVLGEDATNEEEPSCEMMEEKRLN